MAFEQGDESDVPDVLRDLNSAIRSMIRIDRDLVLQPVRFQAPFMARKRLLLNLGSRPRHSLGQSVTGHPNGPGDMYPDRRMGFPCCSKQLRIGLLYFWMWAMETGKFEAMNWQFVGILCSSGRRDGSSSMCGSIWSTRNPRWGLPRKWITHECCERKRMPDCGAREDSDFNSAWRAGGV